MVPIGALIKTSRYLTLACIRATLYYCISVFDNHTVPCRPSAGSHGPRRLASTHLRTHAQFVLAPERIQAGLISLTDDYTHADTHDALGERGNDEFVRQKRNSAIDYAVLRECFTKTSDTPSAVLLHPRLPGPCTAETCISGFLS